MQTEAPEVFDLSRETAGDARPLRRRHGADRRLRPPLPAGPAAGREGRAVRRRRLRRRAGQHAVGRPQGHRGEPPRGWPAQTDQPIAGLLTDLKRRGLLDSTLVLWGGEFGRSPEAQGGKGRDHHNLGFTMWLAGGGIKGGQVGRRDRRHRPAGGREALSLPRHPHDHPAPARPRSGRADLPAPGPPRTADRSPRGGDRRNRLAAC